MQKVIKYAIFKTKWGHFGLVGMTRPSSSALSSRDSSKSEYGLLRTCLPGPKPEKIKSLLLNNLPAAQCDKTLFKTVQQQIAAYFEGVCVNFGPDIPVVLDGFSFFTRSVLIACRDIKFGQRISYSALAKRLGRPAGSRAVGNALAKNPLPLIIPCHRVVRSDGKIGGFSAAGGRNLKEKLLKHEYQTLMGSKSDKSKNPADKASIPPHNAVSAVRFKAGFFDNLVELAAKNAHYNI